MTTEARVVDEEVIITLPYHHTAEVRVSLSIRNEEDMILIIRNEDDMMLIIRNDDDDDVDETYFEVSLVLRNYSVELRPGPRTITQTTL